MQHSAGLVHRSLGQKRGCEQTLGGERKVGWRGTGVIVRSVTSGANTVTY